MIVLLFATVLAATETPAPSPFITQPVWRSAPSREDLAKYRPEDAKVAGRAVIECTVSKAGLLEFCQVLEETPGERFGKAALAITSRFRIGPEDKDGLPTAGRRMRIPLAWDAPVSDSATVIQLPRWVRRPSANDMANVYPRIALRKELGGRSTIVCKILATGRLTECSVVEETPPELGFGAAALKLASYFQMTTTTADGKTVAGGTVRIPLVWTPPI